MQLVLIAVYSLQLHMILQSSTEVKLFSNFVFIAIFPVRINLVLQRINFFTKSVGSICSSRIDCKTILKAEMLATIS